MVFPMISDLSQRIEIRRTTVGEDFGFGSAGITEVSMLTTWAHIKPMKRTTAILQGLSLENQNYQLRIRYNAGRDIRKDDVIVWDSKRYKAITGGTLIEEDKRKIIETIIVIQDG